MKRWKWIPYLLITLSAFAQDSNQNGGFALVELFTSQGCSSCPSADQYLGDLSALAEKEELPIYTLSFHVDYWDYLGWEDPFAKPAFTKRQRDYGNVLGEGRIYTPQMVLNGSKGFVGSNRRLGQTLISQALAKPHQDAVTLTLEPSLLSDTLQVRATLGHQMKGYRLQLALVASKQARKVTAGENHGRRLVHHHVVHAYKSEKLGKETRMILFIEKPESLSRGSYKLIAYVQKPRMGSIVSATMVNL